MRSINEKIYVLIKAGTCICFFHSISELACRPGPKFCYSLPSPISLSYHSLILLPMLFWAFLCPFSLVQLDHLSSPLVQSLNSTSWFTQINLSTYLFLNSPTFFIIYIDYPWIRYRPLKEANSFICWNPLIYIPVSAKLSNLRFKTPHVDVNKFPECK